jgi:ABC-type lipoprotein export system ATPase subunit
MELIAKNISFKYPSAKKYLLQDVNLELDNKKIIGLIGDSGSGKSTFLKLLAKLDSPTEGEIIIDFKNTSEYDLDEMNDYRFQNISFIYQDYNLIIFLL